MESGEEYTFYVHEQDGKTFLCVECGKDPALEDIKEYLEKKGLTIAPKN